MSLWDLQYSALRCRSLPYYTGSHRKVTVDTVFSIPYSVMGEA